MSWYLDTSVVVTAFTLEPQTDVAQAWIADHRTDSMAVSAWVATEFASALATKRRAGSMTDEEVHRATAAFDDMTVQSFTHEKIKEAHFAHARLLTARYEHGLRGADALHLAIAVSSGQIVATRDVVFHRAALASGHGAVLV